ncbi:D-lactate dehydrogenase [Fistulifera solaris]|jgi:D-lactate dehydrogenase|uniref:D-lactate dehydrogenase n=1 Tax=Fistulifera solaris TaxID=1519565 RepID=A0A1Z5K380_FISSO|nr:D-lactate dehydrogenase [Fistulifera solaris]|eukprot:GAX20713.1 D-lactate dehydrogenase [Fistulifera solaris]
MSSQEDAEKLLKETAYFKEAPEALVQELARQMQCLNVEDGHNFFEEGEEIHSVLILEEGMLVRTKMSVDESDVAELRSSLREMPSEHSESASSDDSSVLIDMISGRAQVTGLLHNFKAGAVAYATVSAKGSVKAWLIEGEKFREAITKEPAYALEMMSALSRELRVGTKSLQALVRHSKAGHREGNATTEQKVCKVLCYDATSWTIEGFEPAIKEFNEQHKEEGISIEMEFTTERLSEHSAIFAAGYSAVCLFVNDTANSNVIQTLSLLGVRMIAMRCAGFDRVDTKAARAFGLTVARVPAYSPYAVAEMGIALLMSVNRKIHRANNRVRMANFTLDGGLMGIDIHGKTVGVMGTGNIGAILCNILFGFGANVLCYDVHENPDVLDKGGKYVSKEEILSQSDILFLMMPLLPPTKHTINFDTLKLLKKGMILINTSRGGLIDTKALLKGLQDGTIAGAGLDVYENEQEYFFQDWSAKTVTDSDLVALLGNNKVVLTAHQAFFTQEAVDKIVSDTIQNLTDYYHSNKSGIRHPNNCIPVHH